MTKPTKALPLGDDPAAIQKRFDELFSKTNKHAPKAQDLAALRLMLRKHKELELWRSFIGVDEVAAAHLLSKQRPSPAFALCWQEQMNTLRDELGHKEASSIEQLLISHAVLCWLQLNFLELQYTEVIAGQVEGMTIARASFWDKRLTLAQKRFTRATDALTRTRAMLAAAAYADERRAELAGRNPARTTLRAVNS